jgi:hypothetical protein
MLLMFVSEIHDFAFKVKNQIKIQLFFNSYFGTKSSK